MLNLKIKYSYNKINYIIIKLKLMYLCQYFFKTQYIININLF